MPMIAAVSEPTSGEKKEASDRTGFLRIQGLGFQSSKVGSTWDMQGMHYDV